MVRNWTDGDYVGASDLDEFVSSGNLVFTTTAARDAFLVGDLAPKSGMFATTTSDGMTLKYIVVGGTGYWSPMPGTFLVHVTQGTNFHTLGPSGTITQITNLSTVVGRNYKNWFDTANSRFAPSCPGFYEIDASVCWTNIAGGDRRLWLALNGTVLDATMTVIGNVAQPDPPVYALRTCYVWMNGTTDYLTLMSSHTCSSTQSTSQHNYTNTPSSFTARYAGV